MLWDILLVFLSAAGVVLLLWCFLGFLLRPVFTETMTTLFPAKDDGNGLEQCVRAYAWLREGRLSGGIFLIVDQGLNENGRKTAQKLSETYDWVHCIAASELEELPQALNCSLFLGKRDMM